MITATTPQQKLLAASSKQHHFAHVHRKNMVYKIKSDFPTYRQDIMLAMPNAHIDFSIPIYPQRG